MVKFKPSSYSSNRRVLIICASEDSGKRIAQMLASAQYEAVVTTSAPMGLLLAVERAPQAILCDATMPGLSGASIVKLLKGHRAASGIPLLLITTDETILVPGAAMTLPARFTRDELLHAIQTCIAAQVQKGAVAWPEVVHHRRRRVA